MAKSFKTARTLKIYLEECKEYLARLNQDLVDLEQGSIDDELLQRIGRDLHTLKGSSGMMEFLDIYHISHSAEDDLQALKDKLPAIDKSYIDNIFTKLDRIENKVKTIEDGTYVADDSPPAPAQPEQLTIKEPPAPQPAPPPAPAPDPPKPPEPRPVAAQPAPVQPAAQTNVVVQPGRISLFHILPQDVSRTLDRVRTIIRDIEAKSIVLDETSLTRDSVLPLIDSVDYLYRALVGMGETNITEVLVMLTSLLSHIRDERIKTDSESLEILFKGISRIRECIESLSAGKLPTRTHETEKLAGSVTKKLALLKKEKDFLSPASANDLFDRIEIPVELGRRFEIFEKYAVSRALIDGKKLYDFCVRTPVTSAADLLNAEEQLKSLADDSQFLTVIIIANGSGGAVDSFEYHSYIASEEGFDDPANINPGVASIKNLSVQTVGLTTSTAPAAAVETIAQKEEKAAPTATPARQLRPKQGGADANKATVRVDTDKLDTLVDLIAELLINHNKMEQEITGLKQSINRTYDIVSNLSRISELDEQSENLVTLEELLRTFADTLQSDAPRDAGGLFANRKAIHDLRTIHSRLTELFEVELEKDRLLREMNHDGKTLKMDLDSLHLEFQNDTENIGRVINDLQDETMKLRMLPISTVFQKFHRRVRDMAKQIEKEVEFSTEGEDTVLDKNLIEKIEEPMLHMIRNAVDHGIETRTERVQKGKPPTGKIKAFAYQEGNTVVIEVEDDGKGIDPEKLKAKCLEKRLRSKEELDAMDDREALNLIFIPGFSTAAQVSDLSGRGVGMDVVRDAITKLKGTVEVFSRIGIGSRFKLKLPLTLAIIQAMIVKSAGQKYVFPMDPIESAEQLTRKDINTVEGRQVFRYRDTFIVPLVRLTDVFGIPDDELGDVFPVVVVVQGEKRAGIIVDEVTDKQQVVIKNLRGFLGDVNHISGATIFGDGSIALILDVASIIASISYISQRNEDRRGSSHSRRMVNVLLVDDSLSGRMAQRDMLERMGFVVDMAESGAGALSRLVERSYDIIVTDINMPRMDGYEFTAHVRQMPKVRNIPIIMVTSDVKNADRNKAYDVGANDFLTKPFSDEELRAAIEKHVRGFER